MNATKAQRFHEIDLLKGLACYLMLSGHALRAAPDGFGALSMIDKIIIYAMDFSGPMFFVASGMNVCTFYDRNKDKPGFSARSFYLAQAALLFVLGYTYSLAIGSLAVGIPDIFQGVAVCTALVFVLVSARLPAWAYLAVAALLYAAYWPIRQELDAIGHAVGAVPTWNAIEPYGREQMIKAMTAVKALPLWKRQIAVHFGVLPWVTYFLIGTAVYRTRGRVGEIVLGVFFAGMIGASALIPQAFFSSPVELFFRGVPGYVLQTGGTSGLVFLIARHVYHGAGNNRLAKALEFAGIESFGLLILHFFLITVSIIFLPHLNMYTRAALIIAGTAWLLPVLARKRDAMSPKPGFERRMLAILGVCFVLGAMLSAAPVLYVPARLIGFGSAFAFAFVFGALRGRIRAKYTHTPAAAPAAEG